MVEQKASQAFRPEFYEQAQDDQIRADVISYLGEYRFEVPEFNYKFGIVDGKLVDPSSQEPMTAKAQKAIDVRRKNSLQVQREEAELGGFQSLEKQLKENPSGTVIWFSPPGSKEDGYGDYGFAYAGRVQGDSLKMTAIRLEEPSIQDFNLIANAIWGEASEKSTEDFLRTPKVVDIPEDKVKEFVHGVFEIKTEENKIIFEKFLSKMEGAIGNFTHIVKTGTALQIQQAINTMENLSIEFRDRLNKPPQDNIVFLADYKAINLYDTMQSQRYISKPPPVAGSCGMSGKIESSNIFGKLIGSSENGLFNKNNQEWFTCPKCTYKADGPVGDRCPGCGLTKEQFAEEGGEACD